MKCYGQIVHESGSYAPPMPDQYQQWGSIEDAKDSLQRCWNDFDVDPADPDKGVTLLLWFGEPDPDWSFPCDTSATYPDRVYQLGPRCGVKRFD